MSKSIPEGATLVYYAEPNTREEEFTGPFPAKVTAFFEPKKPETTPRVDLLVMFSRTRAHTKMGVLVSESARKHCATLPPDGFTYDNWYDKIDEKEKFDRAADAQKARTATDARDADMKAQEVAAEARRKRSRQLEDAENERLAAKSK